MRKDKISKEKEKRIVISLLIICLIFFILVSVIKSVNSADNSWPAFNVCCEKTNSGAWCQNDVEGNCKKGYKISQTNCESTSFCKKGCCVDTNEGLCMENTPGRVCSDTNGTWFGDPICNIEQCNLGCCILGDQAAYVTLTRCKKLSGFYGLLTDFRRDVADEVSCIALANSQDKGACVYESESVKTCKMTTRGQCLNKENITTEPDFYKDYLCTADELGTDCGPTSDTICVEGREEVYFKDSCGNPANIYDANMIGNKNYWGKIVSKAESCGSGSSNGNANSGTCGNCDYFKGSICGDGKATSGNKICKNLSCGSYQNGESWCEYQGNTGKGADAVGTRQFRHLCINGEELIEACHDDRGKYCYQESVNLNGKNFSESNCIANRWGDCVDQKEETDCVNTDKRDCHWIGVSEGTSIACVPDVPPGLKFWGDGDASSVCNAGSVGLEVTYYEKLGLTGDLFNKDNWECKGNCIAVVGNSKDPNPDFVKRLNDICTSLGDCGAKVNVANVYTTEGVVVKVDGGGNYTSIVGGLLNEMKKKAGVKI
jgi:hypothetical protein